MISSHFRLPRPFASLIGLSSAVFAVAGKLFGKNSADPRVTHDDTILEFGGFRLDRGERSLYTATGAAVQLTRRLYDLLLHLAERPGRLVEKQALIDAVWRGSVVEENTLSRTISNLRQLLGERGG